MKPDRTWEEEEKYFIDKFLLGSQKHRKTMHYEPIEIVFHLSAPISITYPWMYFDSLVAHLLLVSALGEDFFLLPTKFPFGKLLESLEVPPFPIKHTAGLYHSSASIFDTDRKAYEVMYKKFEDRWAGGKKKIYRGAGYFRDYMIQYIYVPTTKVTFYVCGDREVLTNLCKHVQGLGDNTRIGWGAIKGYEIRLIESDWSIIKDGRAMRPIPEHMLDYASEKAVMAWKSPYWAAETVAVCAPPGAEVRLKNEYKVA